MPTDNPVSKEEPIVTEIAFIDLKAQKEHLGGRIEASIAKVLDNGVFISGPEVAELERQLSAFCGARYSITCANGTDALELVMRAEGISPGHAVFVPAFTFVATAECVPTHGAVPVFVDVRADSFNIDPVSLEAAVAEAKRQGLTPRMVVAVDLFGQPADYPALREICQREGMTLVADAAQGFGGRLHGKSVGTLGDYTTTSFFPAKPLGCYGDGGAVFTEDDERAAILRSLRIHGKGSDKYDNVRIGLNSRLDTLQAAILMEKLSIFSEEIEARNRIAARYETLLGGKVKTPMVIEGALSVWAQYTLVLEDRDAVIAACKAAGVPTAVYYPIPMSRQTGYRNFPVGPGGVPVSERLAGQVLSLPMHPYLDEATQDVIVGAVLTAI